MAGAGLFKQTFPGAVHWIPRLQTSYRKMCRCAKVMLGILWQVSYIRLELHLQNCVSTYA